MVSNRISNRLKSFLILLIIGSILYIFSSMVYKKHKLFFMIELGVVQEQKEQQGVNQSTKTLPQFVLKTFKEASEVKSKFDLIYKNSIWGNAGGGSGPGSTINYTANARSILYEVIKEYSIKSMIDAPCGAFEWMPLLLKNVTDEFRKRGETFRYYGVDVVESIINASRIKWANESDWQFSVCDFSAQGLPENYELIFSRDALQHLSYEKIFYSLRAFSRVKGARYLLVGSYMEKNQNKNIQVGSYFLINLTKKPFNLNQTVRIYNENQRDSNGALKSLLLYDIPNYLSKVGFDQMRTNLGLNLEYT